jgi:hypothetical protein
LVAVPQARPEHPLLLGVHPHTLAVPPPPHLSVAKLQLVPQHGWPVPPHAVHLLAEQAMPVPHGVAPAQQGWVLPPQVRQLPPEHTVPVAEHEVPQHAWAAPPHATHMLLEHIDPLAHTVPQHGWPAAPQAAHMPLDPQVAPVLQVVPQQG